MVRSGNQGEQWRGTGDKRRGSVHRSHSDAELSVAAFSPAAGDALSDSTRVLPADGQRRASIGRCRRGAVAAGSEKDEEGSKSGMR
jgi:hypothetical protein